MVEWFRRFFAPSIFEDEEKTRTVGILNTIGWVAFFILMIHVISRLFSGEFISIFTRIFFASLLFALFIFQLMLRRGRIKLTGYFLTIFFWGALSAQAYIADGQHDASIQAYPIIILLAALLLGWRAGLITGLLSIAMIWFFAFQEYAGARISNSDNPLRYARDITSILAISSVLTYILIYRLNRSLSDSKLELRERLRADEKLQRQAKYLSALHETTFGLLNRLELNPLLDSILMRTGELLDTPHVGIDLVLPDGSGLRQELGTGEFTKWNKVTIQLGEGMVGKIWQTGETLLVEDYEVYEEKLAVASRSGFVTVVGTPLKSGQMVIGTLVVAYRERNRVVTSEQVALLERLAALASLAIDNARLYEEAQKDINERKAIELDLRSSEERFRKVFNNKNIAVSIVTQEEGIFLEANDAFWKLCGLSPETALGRSAVELNLWKQPEDRKQFVKRLLEKGSLQDVEVEFTNNNQKKTTIAFYELVNIKGQSCILCMFYDVSEQKLAENALKSANARTRAIITSIPDMIFEVSSNGDMLDFMASADLVPIMEPQEFIGKNLKDLFPPKIAEQTMFALERAVRTGEVHAFEYGLPPGEESQFFEARVAPVTSGSAIIMVRDISQRKWIETEREKLINELEEKNAESEALRESMAIIVETLDETKAVSLILEQLERVIPFDSASVHLLRKGMLEIVSARRLEPAEKHIGRKFQVNEDEPSYALLTGQANYILLEDAWTNPAFSPEKDPYIRSWLAVPLRVKGQTIGIIALDGQQVGQFTENHAGLAITYANQVTIALENARLFSEAQTELAERKRLIEELEGKNAELERFTYTVSHDLKSPIITIRGFLGFLERDALSGNLPRLQGDIKRISDATEKMQNLLNDLLELSRIGRLVNQSATTPLNQIVSEALELVQGQIQAAHIQVMVQEGMASVYVDHLRIVEVMQNLLDNAAKFTGSDPRIEVGQRGMEGGMAVFFVRDHGIGIDQAHHERIFGLFNKLDANSEGTGIGLAIVKRIIEVHKGRIWVESEPGKGSTFFFTLPTKPIPES